MAENGAKLNREIPGKTLSGWLALPLTLVLLLGGLALAILAFVSGTGVSGENPVWWMFAVGVVGMILGFISFGGYFTLQPNEARVLILFGEYKGTAREHGFHFANPFYSNGPAGTQGEETVAKARQMSGIPGTTGKQAPRAQRQGPKRYKISCGHARSTWRSSR